MGLLLSALVGSSIEARRAFDTRFEAPRSVRVPAVLGLSPLPGARPARSRERTVLSASDRAGRRVIPKVHCGLLSSARERGKRESGGAQTVDRPHQTHSERRQFDSVATADQLPLSKLALLYAENGRAKTTLAAILRSLATGDPVPVLERQRLANSNSTPHCHVRAGVDRLPCVRMAYVQASYQRLSASTMSSWPR